jgi:WD40 repeat protein
MEQWFGHSRHGRIQALAYHPDGRTVISGGDDQRLLFWSPQAESAGPGLPQVEAWSPESVQSKLLAFAESQARAPDPDAMAAAEAIDLNAADQAMRQGRNSLWRLSVPAGYVLDIDAHIDDSNVVNHMESPESDTGDSGSQAAASDLELFLWSEDGTLVAHNNDRQPTQDTAPYLYDVYIESSQPVFIEVRDRNASGPVDYALTVRMIPALRTATVFGEPLPPDADESWSARAGLALARNGSLAITGSGVSRKSGSINNARGATLADSPIQIWQLDSDEPGQRLDADERAHLDEVAAVGLSEDGRRAVTGGWDGRLLMWSLDALGKGSAPEPLTGHTSAVFSLDLSSDGRQLVTAGGGGVLSVWDLEQRAITRTLHGHVNDVLRVVLFADETRALSTSKDESAIVWDLATGEPLQTFDGHGSSIEAAAVSLDGARALTGESTGRAFLWDIATGEELFALPRHVGPIHATAFHPSGRIGATAGRNRMIRLWDLDARKEIGRLLGHGEAVRDIAFASPSQLVSTSQDGTMRVWDVAGMIGGANR